MNEPIAPALTPEEWEEAAIEGELYSRAEPLKIETEPDGITLRRTDGLPRDPEINRGDIPVAISLLNFSLPDTDPRKITWEMVDALRGQLTVSMTGAQFDITQRLADALASYLPPRDSGNSTTREPLRTMQTLVTGQGMTPHYDGVIEFPCPKCEAQLSTGRALIKEQNGRGLTWRGILCHGCGESFTFEATADAIANYLPPKP